MSNPAFSCYNNLMRLTSILNFDASVYFLKKLSFDRVHFDYSFGSSLSTLIWRYSLNLIDALDKETSKF